MALTNAQGKLIVTNQTGQLIGLTATGNTLSSAGTVTGSLGEVVTSGLVAYYKFDGNLNDSSGNGNTLSLNAGTATYGAGASGVGNSFSFDGSTRLRPSGTQLRPSTNFTFDFWMKKTSNSSPHQQMFTLGSGAWTVYLEANDGNTGSIRLDFETSTGAHADYGNHDWVPPEGLLSFHHYVFTYDGSFSRLYVDRILRVKVAFTGTDVFSGSFDQIGQSIGGTNGFIGSLDNFKVYHRALTDGGITTVGQTAGGEISQNFLAEIPQTGITTRGLVSYWKLEENSTASSAILDTAYTSTGVGSNPPNHGTRFGTAPFQDAGISGNCHSFSGDDYIQLPNQSAFDRERTDPFSINMWINPPNGGDGGNLFNKISSALTERGYRFRVTSGTLYVEILNSNVGQYITRTTSSAPVVNNTWQMVTMTYDGSSSFNGINLYHNGNLITSSGGGSLSSTILNDVAPALGAKGDYVHNEQYIGLMDEVSFYTVALTPAEIAQNYKSVSNIIATSGLVSWWRFNNNYKDTALIDTGVGATPPNDGTNFGGTYTFVNKAGFEPGSGTNSILATSSNDYIDVGFASSLQPTSAFTFEMKLMTSPSGDHKGGSFNELFDSGGCAVGNDGFLIATKNGNDEALRFAVNNVVSGDTFVETANGFFQNGVATYAAFTYDGSYMRIYKNGIEIVSTPKTGALTYTFTGAVMSGRVRANQNGSPTDGVTGWANGMRFDFMRLYNRALSATEILQNYRTGI